jgi:hypothetical protein
MLVSRVAAPPVLSRARIPGARPVRKRHYFRALLGRYYRLSPIAKETRLAWIGPHYAGEKS